MGRESNLFWGNQGQSDCEGNDTVRFKIWADINRFMMVENDNGIHTQTDGIH